MHQEPLELGFDDNQVEEHTVVLLVELHTLAMGDLALGREEEPHSLRGLVMEEEGDTLEVEV